LAGFGVHNQEAMVKEALRLMIKLRRQGEVDAAFGKYRWMG